MDDIDIVDIAVGQIGRKEADNTHMRFISWYGGFGRNTAWCAIFVSWCMSQAGITSVPRFASCRVGRDWFKSHNMFGVKGAYTPSRGDIVFFLNNRSHVGLVERINGNTLYTVEGNTSDQVARRSYSLNEATITGYGKIGNKGTGSNASNITAINNVSNIDINNKNKKKKQKKSEELKYLKTVLANIQSSKPLTDSNEYEIKESTKTKNIHVDIILKSSKGNVELFVLDDMSLTYERAGMPGKLEFSCLYDKRIQEGNPLLLYIDGVKIFKGFVFVRSMTKDTIMKVTAYNQLRYLKNKDSKIYENKTASEIIKMIAKDCFLETGTIADTKYKMSKYEDGVTFFDMIQHALDETYIMKNQLYIFYDDVGKLTLKHIKDMKLKTVIDKDTAEDYAFKTSIDSEVFNQIKLGYENEEKGTLDTYIQRDSKNINKWGLLQHYEKIDDPALGKLKAGALLDYYNVKNKSISVSGAFGNIAVRAGSLIPVILKAGELDIKNYMLVEKVTHNFKNKEHRMNLSLTGGDFYGTN